jgi:non-ribosomal peptide synthetase component F
VLEAYQHIAYPFDKLVDDLEMQWDRSRSPLFDVVFSLQNIDTDQGSAESKRLQNIQVGNYATDAASCIFDLIISAIALQDKLTISFCYNTDIFREQTIVLLKDRYLQLLASVVKQPEMKINEIELSENGREGYSTGETNQEALDINFNFN